MSWPSVQMGRAKSTLGNPLAGMRKHFAKPTELKAGDCLLARSCTPSPCNTFRSILY